MMQQQQGDLEAFINQAEVAAGYSNPSPKKKDPKGKKKN
jgi:hypothetical protein